MSSRVNIFAAPHHFDVRRLVGDDTAAVRAIRGTPLHAIGLTIFAPFTIFAA